MFQNEPQEQALATSLQLSCKTENSVRKNLYYVDMEIFEQAPLFLTKQQLAQLLSLSEKQIERQSCCAHETRLIKQIKRQHNACYIRRYVSSNRYVFFIADVFETLGIQSEALNNLTNFIEENNQNNNSNGKATNTDTTEPHLPTE